LTTSLVLILINLKFDIFVACGRQCHLITSVTIQYIAVSIQTRPSY